MSVITTTRPVKVQLIVETTRTVTINRNFITVGTKCAYLVLAYTSASSLSLLLSELPSYCGCNRYASVCAGVIAWSYLALNFCFSTLSSSIKISRFSTAISRRRYKTAPQLLWKANRNSNAISQMVSFPMILNEP